VVDGLLGVAEVRRRHGFDKPFHLIVAGDVYIDPVTKDTKSWEEEAAAIAIWMSRDPRERTGSSGVDN
jgi:hypothetical protein